MRHCENERIKNNLVAMDEYALLEEIIPSVSLLGPNYPHYER
jgi:hypothetical protein